MRTYALLISVPENDTVKHGTVTEGFNRYEAKDVIDTIKNKHGDGLYRLKLCNRCDDEYSPVVTFDVRVKNGTVIED